jgi:hypothetical protein
MDNTLNVFIREQGNEFNKPIHTPSDRVHSVAWPLQDSCKIKEEHMMEYISDL